MTVRLVASLAALLVISSRALAQYTNQQGYTFDSPVAATANSLFWEGMNKRILYRTMLKERGFTDAQLDQMDTDAMLAALGRAAPAEGAAQGPRSFASKFSPQSERLVLPSMAESLAADPAQRAVLLGVLEAGIAAYERDARPAGLDHDVAGATAFYIASLWSVWHDGAKANAQGVLLLARALQERFDTPEFRRVPATDKQRSYEMMLALATYFEVGARHARTSGDAAAQAKLKEAAAGALKNHLNLDPRGMSFTATGLEIR